MRPQGTPQMVQAAPHHMPAHGTPQEGQAAHQQRRCHRVSWSGFLFSRPLPYVDCLVLLLRPAAEWHRQQGPIAKLIPAVACHLLLVLAPCCASAYDTWLEAASILNTMPQGVTCC
jgi:hypothetical protein